jgi:hypothetical protein
MKMISTIALDMVLPLSIGFIIGLSLTALTISHFVLGIVL